VQEQAQGPVPVPAPRPDGEASPREVGYAHPDGTHRIFEVTRDALADDDPDGAGWLVTVADVTERRRSERALRHRALYDQLTGLPNRYLLRDRLEMAAARQQRAGGHGTAVLFLDLDRFKAVNDTRGHAAGDQLLRQAAGRLAAVVRASDTVCRLGGDEFVVVCEDIDGSGAESVVERVQAELRRPYDVAGGPVEVGVSIGVALSPPYPLEELVHLADLAMYRAKRAGGDGAALAGPDDRS
jgi:diguanylate cyclase (GGDEF)-like protein